MSSLSTPYLHHSALPPLIPSPLTFIPRAQEQEQLPPLNRYFFCAKPWCGVSKWFSNVEITLEMVLLLPLYSFGDSKKVMMCSCQIMRAKVRADGLWADGPHSSYYSLLKLFSLLRNLQRLPLPNRSSPSSFILEFKALTHPLSKRINRQTNKIPIFIYTHAFFSTCFYTCFFSCLEQ